MPRFSSRYFNKIKRTSHLGRLLALSLEILSNIYWGCLKFLIFFCGVKGRCWARAYVWKNESVHPPPPMGSEEPGERRRFQASDLCLYCLPIPFKGCWVEDKLIGMGGFFLLNYEELPLFKRISYITRFRFFCRIRKDFSFDDAISQHFGCKVHSFDPGYVNSLIPRVTWLLRVKTVSQVTWTVIWLYLYIDT